jgi:DnaJ-class molecular chaperone
MLVLQTRIAAMTPQFDDSEDSFDETFDPNPDPETCPTCSGSGEGRYDGTRCQYCNGNGEL